jgi:hypothetical protein
LPLVAILAGLGVDNLLLTSTAPDSSRVLLLPDVCLVLAYMLASSSIPLTITWPVLLLLVGIIAQDHCLVGSTAHVYASTSVSVIVYYSPACWVDHALRLGILGVGLDAPIDQDHCSGCWLVGSSRLVFVHRLGLPRGLQRMWYCSSSAW